MTWRLIKLAPWPSEAPRETIWWTPTHVSDSDGDYGRWGKNPYIVYSAWRKSHQYAVAMKFHIPVIVRRKPKP